MCGHIRAIKLRMNDIELLFPPTIGFIHDVNYVYGRYTKSPKLYLVSVVFTFLTFMGEGGQRICIIYRRQCANPCEKICACMRCETPYSMDALFFLR
jgi:hypothetical protein